MDRDRAAFDVENARMKAAMPSFDMKVKLNVGGVRFNTLRSTLLSFEDTMLGRVFGRCDLMLQADPGDGSVFNDRDGEQFGLILDFFRDSASYVAGTVRAASRASKAGDGARAGLFRPLRRGAVVRGRDVLRDELEVEFVCCCAEWAPCVCVWWL